MMIFLNTSKFYGLLAFALLLTCMGISACAPKSADRSKTLEPILTRDKPFGPSMTFAELLRESLDRQYSDISSIFTVPEDPANQEMLLINREKPRLILARGVTAYVGGQDYLAAGFSNGNIRIWSDWPCPMLTLPAQETVHKLWWNNSTPFLSASGPDSSQISIYDLRQCARVGDMEAKSAVFQFAVSPGGKHVACVDAGRRLWSGDYGGLRKQQATLRYDPLDLAFSPESGLLMAADQAGWLILWTVPDYQLLDQVFISEGPFDRARFDHHRLIFQKGKTPPESTLWNIPRSRLIQGETEQGRFILEHKVLYYVLPEPKWVKKVLMSPPKPQVTVDPEYGIFQILDLDGEIRYYLARSGEHIQDPPVDLHTQPVQISSRGSFSWGQNEYALADAVLVGKSWALWSRHIPGQGHYLWWAPHQKLSPREFADQLPSRTNIRAEIPPQWVDVEVEKLRDWR